MAGISSKALKPNYAENKYKFNEGSELQNKEFSDGTGIEDYDFDARTYDPQIGRFLQLDPLGDATPDWSPCVYAYDNPILFNDPLGLEGDSTAKDNGAKLMETVIVTAAAPCKTNCTPQPPDVANSVGPAPASASAPINGGAPNSDKQSLVVPLAVGALPELGPLLEAGRGGLVGLGVLALLLHDP